jgi:hypothetical protein
MTRLIPKVLLFMMVVSLFLTATAAADMTVDPDMFRAKEEHHRQVVIDSIFSRHSSSSERLNHLYPQWAPEDPVITRLDQILGNASGTSNRYTAIDPENYAPHDYDISHDRLQDFFSYLRTKY